MAGHQIYGTSWKIQISKHGQYVSVTLPIRCVVDYNFKSTVVAMKQIENKISNNTIILKHVKMENNDTIIKISTPDSGPAHLML